MIEEKLEKELESLLDKLAQVGPNSPDYKFLLGKAASIQKILSSETERVNKTVSIKLEEQKVDIQKMKLDIDRSNLEIETWKIKQVKRQNFWELGKEFLKGLIFVGANGVLIGTTIALNNSGEVLPPIAQKMIIGKKL